MSVRLVLSALLGGALAMTTFVHPAAGQPGHSESLDAVAKTGAISQTAGSALINDVSAPARLHVDSARGPVTVDVVDDVAAAAVRSSDGLYSVHAAKNDVEYVVADKPASGGAIFSVMHSAEAPHDFSYEIRVGGAPATLLIDDATGLVTVSDASGEVVNVVLPPWAVDAEGQNVDTHYEVDGSRLTQVVSLQGDESFPVTADPELACDGLFCTVELNRAETREASIYAGADSLWVAGACLVAATIPEAGAAASAACAAAVAAYGATIEATAKDALETGGCLSLRFPQWAFQIVIVPVIHRTGNCY